MNYGKKGIKKKQKALTSTSAKVTKMFTVNLFKAMLICIVGVGIIGLCAGIGAFQGILKSAPEISLDDIRPKGFSTVVYDNKGNQLTKLVTSNSNRSYRTLDKIPIDVQHAFVAIEDARYYEHNGIDIKGIIRAAYVGLSTGHFSEGASTITQQLLKNNVFTDWVSESSFVESLRRKLQEQYLALELEKTLGGDAKDVILEAYLNTINLGQNTLGVQTASQRYFNKDVSDLTLSEAAVIAAITQNPTKFNPISHPEDNEDRRYKVLTNMLDLGYINQSEYDSALADNVYSRIKDVNAVTGTESVYTYFVDELTEQVLKDLQEIKGYSYTQAYNALYSGGLSIYTTQDSEIQRISDAAVADESNYPEDVQWLLDYTLTIEHADGKFENYSSQTFEAYIKQNDKKFNRIFDSADDEQAKAYTEDYKASVMGEGDTFIAEKITWTPQPQVSVTIMDQTTGHVLAIVGGRGTKQGSLTLNRATGTTRQPGSTFKILSTYAPAFDSAGKTLASIQIDEPYTYANGRPVSNWYGEAYKGACTLRYGIEQSLNIVAVKTLTDITPQLGYDYLRNFGFTTLTKDDIIQSLALGGITLGVSNIELNAAYAAIANKGTYIEPLYYTKILDHDGNVLIEKAPNTKQVIKETTAFLLTDAMVDVVTKGTGRSVNFGNMAIAGKTGTTSSYVDVWFSGYTPYYTCTAWAGYDNNVHLRNSTEKNLAKVIWKQIMSQIHEGLEYRPFTTPEGIVSTTICTQSGKLAIPNLCNLAGSTLTEYFAQGTQPTEACDVHILGSVCAETGLPAAESCPYKTDGVINGSSAEICPHNGLTIPAIDPITGLPLPTLPTTPADTPVIP